ncbi:MAG: PIN domain nuclease [Dehalococcoidia bacterium]|nr:PIN domain nuclease [Dehalococcoidia bacterium]
MLSYVIARVIGASVLGAGGWLAGPLAGEAWVLPKSLPGNIAGAVAGVLVGGLLTPYVTVLPYRAILRTARKTPGVRILAAVLGLITGLVLALLLSAPLARIPGWPGIWVPIALSALFGIMGALVALSRERDLVQFLPQGDPSARTDGRHDGQIIMDTSAIIDGRIADISQTGFVHGTLVIPRFVLDELRHIADSSDSARRNRGRRGLEMLNKLRKEAIVPIQVTDVDQWDGMEVDAKLVKLAKSLGAPILTTDFNLNRVAEIQGVRVLNVNELANALKSVVLPGEELRVHVIQEGKEAGQGVAFLDDGTMVVVENGRRYLDNTIDVAVTRVLQTAAGRLIFAQTRAR